MNASTKAGAAHRAATTVATVALLVTLWPLIHRYEGLGGDAELYAFQALAKIQPSLSHDLYLANTSQADYTIFSSLYAFCINLLGLHDAAMILLIIFKVWFFSGAWLLARVFMNRDTAFLAVALLIILSGSYGAFDVFRFSEDWLTARSFAEALLITSFWMYFRLSKAIGACIALLALLVHPLLGLPGTLLLVGLWSPVKVSTSCALGGFLAALCLALTVAGTDQHIFAAMGTHWLNIVRERSQFLFLDLWRPRDWLLNFRPLLALTLSAIVLGDLRIKKLCAMSITVGATGLAIALIGSLPSPMAILLQGQAWRWIWVSTFFAILFVAPTAIKMWRDERCGPLCALLIVSAWTLSAAAGVVCVAAASTLWFVRERFSRRTILFVRWIAVAYAAAVLAWALQASWFNSDSLSVALPGQPNATWLLRKLFGVNSLAAPIAFLAILGLSSRRTWEHIAVGMCLLAISAFILPSSFVTFESEGTSAEMADLREWRNAIPTASNVLVLPLRNSARFAWFTLRRPSYLSLNQSSGVVFSEATALEVERRSDVLLPVSNPDWQLLTNMRNARGTASTAPASRPVSREGLVTLCADPKLNFVVAKEDVGFHPLANVRAGKWKDWNLYDCSRLRADTSRL